MRTAYVPAGRPATGRFSVCVPVPFAVWRRSTRPCMSSSETVSVSSVSGRNASTAVSVAGLG